MNIPGGTIEMRIFFRKIEHLDQLCPQQIFQNDWLRSAQNDWLRIVVPIRVIPFWKSRAPICILTHPGIESPLHYITAVRVGPRQRTLRKSAERPGA